MKGIIYKATNTLNGKVYVGQTTKGIEKRRRDHEHNAEVVTYPDERKLYGAIAIYGADKFKWEVLEEIETDGTIDDLRLLLLNAERRYIGKFQSYDQRYGYNISGNPMRGTAAGAGRKNPNGPIIVFDIMSAKPIGEFISLVEAKGRLGVMLVYPKILNLSAGPKPLIVNNRVRYVAFYARRAGRVGDYIRNEVAIKLGGGRLFRPGRSAKL